VKKEKFTDEGGIVLDLATMVSELEKRLGEFRWRNRKAVGAWIPLNMKWPVGTRVNVTVERIKDVTGAR